MASGAAACAFLRWAFSNCAVDIFAVKVVTLVDSSAIVFINIATDVLSACVGVATFASAMVWSFYVSVNKSALACADCALAAYLLVFEVLEDFRVSLNALVK